MSPASKKKTSLQKRFQAYFLLLINTFCWGAAFIFIKPAFAITTPFRFLFYRYILAAGLSLPFLLYYWPKIKNKLSALWQITLIEILGVTIALTLLYFGLDRTSAIEASLIANTTPIFTVLAGILFLKEKQEKNEWLGLAMAIIGTFLLTFLPLVNGFTLSQGISLEGNLLIIGQNITIAIYYILAKKYYHRLPKFFVSSFSFWIGLISFAFLSLAEQDFSLPSLQEVITIDITSLEVIFASVYMAIFGSIIGLTVYIKGQDDIEASEASLFTYLQPLIYIPLGIILLNETVNPIQILALILIIFGVLIAEKRSFR